MSETRAVRYEKEIPEVFESMAGVHKQMDRLGFDRTIHHLVQLRASQINRCGFCVNMHTREALEDGETTARLNQVVVWDQVGSFNEREQAALAWTEALTVLDPKIDLGPLRAQLRKQFSEVEIGILTSTIAMINLWNRINISRH